MKEEVFHVFEPLNVYRIQVINIKKRYKSKLGGIKKY